MPREYLPERPAGYAKRVLHHALEDCETRLTFSGLCPYCGYNPDTEELAVRWYCPTDNVPLDDSLRCPKCAKRFVEPATDAAQQKEVP